MIVNGVMELDAPRTGVEDGVFGALAESQAVIAALSKFTSAAR